MMRAMLPPGPPVTPLQSAGSPAAAPAAATEPSPIEPAGELPRAAALRLGAAVVGLLVAATAARLLLDDWLGTASPLLPYAFAIALASVWWGLWPGLLATGLAAASAAWFFLPPAGSFAIASPAQRVSLLLFAALGILLAVLGERARRSQQRALHHGARLQETLAALGQQARSLQEALAARDRSIAELEATDRRLRHAVEEFESLMRLAPVGIAVARDARGEVIHGNAYAERLVGAAPGANLVARPPGDPQATYRVRRGGTTLDPADLPLQQVARTGRAVTDALHEVELPGGDVRSILVSAVPLRDASGEARGAIGTMLDVTALRTVQSQLAARQTQLRTLFEAMTEGYGIVEAMPVGAAAAAGCGSGTATPEWRLVEANAAFARLAALPGAVGRTLREAAAGRELPWLECCARVLAGGTAVESEYCDPGLQQRWFKVDAYPLGLTQGARVAVFLRETTERKRADQDAAFLLYLADQMRLGAGDPDTLAATVLRSLRAHLGADRVRLTEVDVASRRSRVIREVTQPGVPQVEPGQDIEPIDSPALRRLASGCPWVVEDVGGDPAAGALVRAQSDTRAFVVAPLLRGGQWVASLGIGSARPRQWSPRETRLLETVAERLWAALEIARAGASLRESEQRFRLMADGLPMPVWVHDARGALVFVNREYCRFFGVTLAQVTGAGWQPLIHPDDGPGYVAEFERCLRERGSFHAQTRVRDASGAWRWMESHGEPRFLDDGTLLGYVGASTDVTDRRQSQLDRDFLFELGDALQRCRGRATIAEAAARRLGDYLGVDRCGVVEAPLGAGPPTVLREYLPGRDPPFTGPRPMQDPRLAFAAELRSGATMVVADVAADPRAAAHLALFARLDVRALVTVPLRRGGELAATLGVWQARPRQWTVREVDLVRSVAGRLWPALETAQAMEASAALAADRERLLDAERAARGEVEAANRLKDEFLATISHELRTPLANIVSWTYVVQQSLGRDADAVRRGLGIIAGNARAQSNLISDLLDMSRSVEGKLRLDCAPLALGAFVAECVESHAPAAADAGLRLEYACHVGADERIHGDARRLRQVLGNLLTNALKFTPAGGQVRVELAAAAGGAGAGYEIEVIDDGEGIDPALLPQLFARFRQGDSSASRQHGGLGIGLSLVRQLVELHGGSVTAHSEGRGRGAIFRVFLPANAACGPAPTASALDPGSRPGGTPGTEPPEPDSGGSAGAERHPAPGGDPYAVPGPDADADACRGLRILAVEDEAAMREFMQRTLEERGATVRAVATAAEALRLLQEHGGEGFDVLVSDIGLPELDGYRLVRRIRDELRIDATRLPAIAVTAFSRDEDRSRSVEAGFQAHLAKPYSVVQLVRLIARQVRRGEAGRH